MPNIPDFIKKRMDERLDYGTEEFVARRVLRAGGIVGKQAVKELRSFFFGRYEDPTLFIMATFLLTRRMVFHDLRVEAGGFKTKKQARDAYLDAPDFGDDLMVLARCGNHGAYAYLYMEGYPVIDTLLPPYTVLARRVAEDGEKLLIEQDLETFCEGIGVKNAVEDILHERLRV